MFDRRNCSKIGFACAYSVAYSVSETGAGESADSGLQRSMRPAHRLGAGAWHDTVGTMALFMCVKAK